MCSGEQTGCRSPGGCRPRPLWQAGGGPWHTPGFPGKDHGSPRLAGHREQRKLPCQSPQGSSLFFWPKLCLPLRGGGPLCPTESSRQEEITFAKLGAKNSSAHPSKAGQADWTAPEVSRNTSPSRSPRGPRGLSPKGQHLSFKPPPSQCAALPQGRCECHSSSSLSAAPARERRKRLSSHQPPKGQSTHEWRGSAPFYRGGN